jgi:predicted Rdx family selenoprotein
MVLFACRCDDGEVALIPSTGGVFDVRANGQLLPIGHRL